MILLVLYSISQLIRIARASSHAKYFKAFNEVIFYDDLVYKFKRIVGKPNFSDQFKKIVKRYIRVAYNLDIM